MLAELQTGGVGLRFLLAVPAAYARNHDPSDTCVFDLGACPRTMLPRPVCLGPRRPKPILHPGTNNPSASVAIVPLRGVRQRHIFPSSGANSHRPCGFCRRRRELTTVRGTGLLYRRMG